MRHTSPGSGFHLPRGKSFTHALDQVLDVMKHMKHEKDSEAHQIFGQSAGHAPKGVLPQTVSFAAPNERTIANGFSYTAQHEWANLGQGAPEVGMIPNAPPRLTTIEMSEDSLEYAPTTWC
ncbi:hypothetical protein D9757_008378 [Collybiopsis confluens]|uniref:Uncharacterized protein n=1 Tax=Collybiopsis confluens TaxID=2823264 RepID=A0A8H5M790_9AGAR|nr:hypothetical protein D9757_008378 [Collybiopsis confluens]